MTKQKPDFSGYATKNDIVCLDGRTIRRDAFKHDNGKRVPLVWMHNSSDPSNILGHAELENRPDGVYAHCYFNDSSNAKNAKGLVMHNAITALSIYANKLGQVGKDVRSGVIREVSLVLGGANPGALIDTVSFSHGDFDDEDVDEAIITSGETLVLMHSDESIEDENEDENEDKNEDVKHAEAAEESAEDDAEDDEETVEDVLATLTDKQKAAVGFVIEEMVGEEGTEEDAEHSDEEDHMTKKNVFDRDAEEQDSRNYLSHADFSAIVESAKKTGGSLKEATLAYMEENGLELRHAGGTDAGYGIENIGYLFPDARNVTATPTFIQRDQSWVAKVYDAARHTPFSRIKSVHADITADEARAKGYVTGNRKMEEVFRLLRRTTTPTTVYKKQKLDRDDMVDITDLDVVAWIKAEMRLMLNEEIARAAFLGDGRLASDEDKIDETCIRPIAFDDSLYTVKCELATDTPAEIIDEIIRSRKDYKGTGNPSLFCSLHVLTDMLLIKDTLGHRIYKTVEDLAAALMVKEIVPVEVMTESTVYDETHELYAVLVNMNDYTFGADKGGEINLFDDFDIDYNQYKYLMEGRCSGALTKPYSAIAYVTDTTSGAMG